MNAAATAGNFDQLQMRLSLQSRTHSNLSATNAIAVLPGSSSSETLVINAHADAWFDGAGDNGRWPGGVTGAGQAFRQAAKSAAADISTGRQCGPP